MNLNRISLGLYRIYNHFLRRNFRKSDKQTDRQTDRQGRNYIPCTRLRGWSTKSLLTRYLRNRLLEFHKIYNVGALWANFGRDGMGTTLTFDPMTLKTWTVRLPRHVGSILYLCKFFVQIPSALHQLSSSHDFHGRCCMTLTSDLMTLKISVGLIRTRMKYISGISFII